MNRWLIKSDPQEYGFDDLARDKTTVWDGIANPQALGYIAKMAKGDPLLVYHSGKDKSIVGSAEVAGAPFPDPDQDDPKLLVVKIKAGKKAPHPVTLRQIKADKAFADFALVRQPRLSVMPVTAAAWTRLCKMAGL